MILMIRMQKLQSQKMSQVRKFLQMIMMILPKQRQRYSNVEACIHQENYGIFFYEPAAKQKIELFEAKWTFESLTDVFSQIAAHINRREFEDNDYQVIVCVRKHKRASRHQMNAQPICKDTHSKST